MSSIHVPPTDPREVEALRSINEQRSVARSQSRWAWATVVPRLFRLWGMAVIVWACVGFAAECSLHGFSYGALAVALARAASGVLIMVCGTWAYRYAYQRAFGAGSRSPL